MTAEVAEPAPLPAATPRTFGVAALLLAVGDALATRFSACSVQGELSGFSRAASGHCYFTLKDAEGAPAAIRCAMFRRAASLLDFAPRDGQKVELRGRIALYEPRGEMQFVAESMRPLGDGTLFEQFLRLKAKLEAEGLFDASRKRALPAYPRRIGIVTSPSGAALHDVLTTLSRRAPHVEALVLPSLVQGPEAPAALLRALEAAAVRHDGIDLLIVARGGGSLEDLWAFNDERVVRAVATMPMPVISGVGHETDVTLCDFAADWRAATPTAAAEHAAPERAALMASLDQLALRLQRALGRRLDNHAQRLDRAALQLSRPAQALARAAQSLQALGHRHEIALRAALDARRAGWARWRERLREPVAARLPREHARLQAQAGRLAALDPQRVLERGYAFVLDAQGQPVTSTRAVSVGQSLSVQWHDGRAGVRVETTRRLAEEARTAPGARAANGD
jgi:exodeoxyribonuclease VII large subunit